MLREFFLIGDGTVAETGRVVVGHGLLVVGIEVVDEQHAFDGVALLVEFAEDVHQVFGNGFVAHHLSRPCLSVFPNMHQAQVAQVFAWDGAVLGVGLSLHALENMVGDGFCPEEEVHAEALHVVLADANARFPLLYGLIAAHLLLCHTCCGYREEQQHCDNFVEVECLHGCKDKQI